MVTAADSGRRCGLAKSAECKSLARRSRRNSTGAEFWCAVVAAGVRVSDSACSGHSWPPTDRMQRATSFSTSNVQSGQKYWYHGTEVLSGAGAGAADAELAVGEAQGAGDTRSSSGS